MGKRKPKPLREWIKKQFPECQYYYLGKTESPEWWTEGKIEFYLGSAIKLSIIYLGTLTPDRYHRGPPVSYELQIGKWETDLSWQQAVGYMHIIRGKCVRIEEEARKAIRGLPWNPCDFQVGHLGVLKLQELCLLALREKERTHQKMRVLKGTSHGCRTR
ncbi:vif protein [Simian immunodeficiency virus]|uniref:Vif protein n=1 Tax=Simian immunodeficiency virus TaxID=11723 RepID=Q99FI0_SIV|nr:vif protein [Simian immunodeficiency virus]